MERINSFDALGPLLTAQLRRGLVANAPLSPERFRADAQAGALWAHAWADGLLLLRRREGFWRMNFYLRLSGSLPDLPPTGLDVDGPVVMELPKGPRDTGMDQTLAFWQREGFFLLFHRERLALTAAEPPASGPFPVRAAGPCDGERISALLHNCFDPLTGCLPTWEELAEGLREGQFLLAQAPDESGGGVGNAVGVLHLCPEGRVSTQLRHLAVDEKYRNRGAAGSLLAAYLTRCPGRSLVWVRRDNAPAQAFYRKHGYVPDGWTSAVFCRK